ncbi:MAG: ankyrin repeat domain-containing protein [Tatlockia sp.]|jgi:hypothetical protein
MIDTEHSAENLIKLIEEARKTTDCAALITFLNSAEQLDISLKMASSTSSDWTIEHEFTEILFYAIGMNDRALFDALLPWVDVDLRNRDGRTPLMEAASRNDLYMVEELIFQHADLRESYFGLTAFDMADNQTIKAILPSNPPYVEMAQSYLLDKMKQLRATSDSVYCYEGGVCHGFAIMAILAFLDHNQSIKASMSAFEQFKQLVNRLYWLAPEVFTERIETLQDKRIRLISEIKKHRNIAPDKLLNQQEQKALQKEVNCHFVEKELLDLALPVLFDGIEIAQQLYLHKAIHEEKITRQIENFPVMDLLISDHLIAQKGVALVKEYSGVFDEKELAGYFKNMKQQLRKKDFRVSLFFMDIDHTLSVHFNPQNQCWFLTDSNQDLYETPRNKKIAKQVALGYQSPTFQFNEEITLQQAQYNSYVLVEETLFYKDNQGVIEEITIPDYPKFKEELDSIKKQENKKKMDELSFQQYQSLIAQLTKHRPEYLDYTMVTVLVFCSKLHAKQLTQALDELDKESSFQHLFQMNDKKSKLTDKNGVTLQQLNDRTNRPKTPRISFKTGFRGEIERKRMDVTGSTRKMFNKILAAADEFHNECEDMNILCAIEQEFGCDRERLAQFSVLHRMMQSAEHKKKNENDSSIKNAPTFFKEDKVQHPEEGSSACAKDDNLSSVRTNSQ